MLVLPEEAPKRKQRSKIDKSLQNMIELLPLFEDSQGYCQQDDHVVSFVLALGDQWPLVPLLDLCLLLAQRLHVVQSMG